jgi:uncharacterized NAD-dependent epimerase/dehydratase family protein
VHRVGGDRRPLETSRRGVFAIGDVRSGSVKRVAAAVGEGAQVVAGLHSFLATVDRPETAVSRRAARRSNGVPRGIQESATGILHQVPTISDLDRLRKRTSDT